MTTSVATKPAPPSTSLIARFAAKRGIEPEKLLKTLKDTVFKLPNGNEVSNEQMLVLLSVAEKYNLDPMVREIYAFPSKGGGVVPIVGYDGWISMMLQHPQYDGHETTDGPDEKGMPAWIECRVYRKDHAHPTTVREYMIECKRGTEPWSQWPRRMLRIKSTIQAARAAFGFGGIADPDEAERIVQGEVVSTASGAIADINEQVKKKPAKEDRPPLTLDGEMPDGPNYAEVRTRIDNAKTHDDLDEAQSMVDGLPEQFRPELHSLAASRREKME